MILWLDFETRSKRDLPSCGVYNYARDLSTEVICMSYAFDDEEVQTWTPDQRFPPKVAKHRGMIFEDKKAKEHKSELRRYANAHKPEQPLEGPVEVRILAVLPRPKALCAVSKRTGLPLAHPGRRWHTGKPDKDNIEKAVLDAMSDWWMDDAQVCVGCTIKQVAAFREEPHYEIMVVPVSAHINGAAQSISLTNMSAYWFMEYPF